MYSFKSFISTVSHSQYLLFFFQRSHFIYRDYDGSSCNMLSHKGKAKTKTHVKERLFYKALTRQQNLRTKNSDSYRPELRTKKKKIKKDERFEKMELLRGVYTISQVSYSFPNKYTHFSSSFGNNFNWISHCASVK